MQALEQPKLGELRPTEIPSTSEQNAPIQLAPYDVLKLLFEYISLGDLNSLGLTCKHLHQAAGEYFRQNYPLEFVNITKVNGKVVQQTNFRKTTNLACFTEQLWIECREPRDNMEYFRYVAKLNNKNVKSILFLYCTDFTEAQGQCLAETMKSVEYVEFSSKKRGPKHIDQILQFCPNLKHLKLYCESGVSEWPRQHYSMLECLNVYNKMPVASNDDRFNGLKSFLQNNPQIKKFAVGTYANTKISVNDVLQLIEEANMHLDKIELESDSFKPAEVIRINEFQERGHCKEVQITCWGAKKNSFVNLTQIHNLHALKIHGHISDINLVASVLAGMSNLKVMQLERINSIEEAELLSKSLLNLEVLHLQWISLDKAMPFVRNLPKLKSIQISKESSEAEFKVKQLNDARKQLTNAPKLTVELHPDVFLQFRWALTDLDYELIEFQRATKTTDQRMNA